MLSAPSSRFLLRGYGYHSGGCRRNECGGLDFVGSWAAVTSLAGSESYTLDSVSRITGVAYPNGHNVSYTYDPNGNRLTMTVNGNTTTYTYDDAAARWGQPLRG